MRARLPSWPAFAPALVLVVACAGRGGCAGHGVHRTGSQREAQACTAWASNHCRRLEACAPVSLQAGYGDVETCVARNEVGCDAALRAPGTGATAASIEACAAASGAASCEDVVVGRAPAGCAVSGTLQAGAACGDDSQCAGAGAGGGGGGGAGTGAGRAYCKMAADETCGLCATVGATGDTCESDRDCEHGLVCYFTCLEPVREGEACDGMRRQCPQTLVCLDYRCVPQPGVGATCNPAADPCDHDHGLYCERETRRCAPYVVARPGAACGVETLCRRGTCATEDDPSQPGRCVANADDGMPCDSAAGPACTPPARCVRGRCAMPDPARCR